jgi:translation initiation factor eIF-2B subunit epsilon
VKDSTCANPGDVNIKDSHLWEKVCIFDNVNIDGCVLCEGVVIRAGVTLGTGCVIGKGCIIGENVVVPPFTRITLCAKDDEGDGYDDAFSSSKCSSRKEDDDEEEDIVEDENEEESDDEIISMEEDFLVLCDNAFISDHHVVGKMALDAYGIRLRQEKNQTMNPGRKMRPHWMIYKPKV